MVRELMSFNLSAVDPASLAEACMSERRRVSKQELSRSTNARPNQQTPTAYHARVV